jgi:predicted dithiol-disulfide oxidoreductase (DUF899 family)
MHDTHFPGETPAYRHARDELLKAEVELRRQVELVAAQRRSLPLGGPVPEDYVFEEAVPPAPATRSVAMTDLFEAKKDTLVLYSYMFGPRMDKPCPMCTSFVDALHGNALALRQHVNLAIVARSPIARVREFTDARGWSDFRVLSSADNTYSRDYHGETPAGAQNTVLHVFVKKDGRVYHSWSSELAFVPTEPGQNQRHIDPMWPLWNVLDTTPGGRPKDWFPGL